MIIRTEWFWSNERIKEALEYLTGFRVYAVYRSTGLWADIVWDDGSEWRIYDGDYIADRSFVSAQNGE